jgi:hypothetical protein
MTCTYNQKRLAEPTAFTAFSGSSPTFVYQTPTTMHAASGTSDSHLNQQYHAQVHHHHHHSTTALVPHSPESSASGSPPPTPVTTSSSKRRRNRDTPPRPLNSFMIYRREYQKRIKEQHPNIMLSELSRISKSAAEEWACESQAVKQQYAEKAKQEKERHMKLYPNYVYCPRRPSRGNKRKKPPSASNATPTTVQPDNSAAGSSKKMSLGYLLNSSSSSNADTSAFRPYHPR